MRAGLCCVASDLPGARALFGDEPAGIVVESDAELPAVLTDAADDAGADWTHSVERARLRYESHYSVEAMVAATDRCTGGVRGEVSD